MFKGIVIFGEPATGKSTIARKIAVKIPNCKIIEASTHLIFPIAHYFKKLPNNSRALFSKLQSLISKKSIHKARASRAGGRRIFSAIEKRYSPSFIGETLDKLYVRKYPNKLVVFSGVRGYENAKYFKNWAT